MILPTRPNVLYWAQDVDKLGSADLLNLLQLKSGDLDFLIGGLPCQGFSPNGKRWLKDNRNRLFARFIQVARDLRPKCVILENVPTALSAFAQIFDEEVQEAFKGYVVRTAVLNACAFGVPQIRRRAFVVALRDDLGITDFKFPSGSFDAMDVGRDSHTEAKQGHRFVCVEDAIGDLPEVKAGDGFDGARYPHESRSDYQRERRNGAIALFNHIARAHSKAFLTKISPIQPGEGMHSSLIMSASPIITSVKHTRAFTHGALVSRLRLISATQVLEGLLTIATTDP